MSVSSDRVPSPSVSRALLALEVLATSPCTLGELSRKLGVPKSTLQGIMATLMAHGWVRHEDGRFVVGSRLFQVGVLYGRDRGLRAAFREVGVRVVHELGETTFVGVMDGLDILHLARLDGTQTLRYIAREGERVPVHATALGQVILADMTPEELTALFGKEILPALTPRTITRLSLLQEHLRTVRMNGYAFDDGQVDEELNCVAVPIRDATERVLAAMAVAAPAFRLTADRLPYYLEVLSQSAREISRRLGYSAAKQA